MGSRFSVPTEYRYSEEKGMSELTKVDRCPGCNSDDREYRGPVDWHPVKEKVVYCHHPWHSSPVPEGPKYDRRFESRWISLTNEEIEQIANARDYSREGQGTGCAVC